MANWIPKNLKKGALHRDLGIPEDKPIPWARLVAAAKKKGKTGKRARLAMAFRKMKR